MFFHYYGMNKIRIRAQCTHIYMFCCSNFFCPIRFASTAFGPTESPTIRFTKILTRATQLPTAASAVSPACNFSEQLSGLPIYFKRNKIPQTGYLPICGIFLRADLDESIMFLQIQLFIVVYDLTQLIYFFTPMPVFYWFFSHL